MGQGQREEGQPRLRARQRRNDGGDDCHDLRGTIRQTSYDSKDGKVYTYDLSAREFSLLERAPAQESTDEPEERGTTQAPSSDAPF